MKIIIIINDGIIEMTKRMKRKEEITYKKINTIIIYSSWLRVYNYTSQIKIFFLILHINYYFNNFVF